MNSCGYQHFSWGVDIKLVNIAFNNGMPEDSNTCLHYVVKASHFGTMDVAVMFVSDEKDAEILNYVQDRFEIKISELPVG